MSRSIASDAERGSMRNWPCPLDVMYEHPSLPLMPNSRAWIVRYAPRKAKGSTVEGANNSLRPELSGTDITPSTFAFGPSLGEGYAAFDGYSQACTRDPPEDLSEELELRDFPQDVQVLFPQLRPITAPQSDDGEADESAVPSNVSGSLSDSAMHKVGSNETDDLAPSVSDSLPLGQGPTVGKTSSAEIQAVPGRAPGEAERKAKECMRCRAKGIQCAKRVGKRKPTRLPSGGPAACQNCYLTKNRCEAGE
jgi:hypothetical protein